MATEPKLVISARIEEVPVLARFTRDSYIRDKADFEGYKPLKYIPTYATGLLGKITAVEAIIFPKVLTAELEVISKRIIDNMLLIRPLLNRLEGYVADAAGLTVSEKNFGISPVRKKINNDDQEGLDGALHYLLTNIGNATNLAALQAVGYDVADKAALEGLKLAILNDNVAQNNKIQARAQLRVDNLDLINDLCKDLKGVWADCKRLYKISNKTKTKDYTLTQLKNRIRAEELKTELTGTVFKLSGTPVDKKAKIVARPVGGGRSKTVYSDKNSKYDLKGLKAVPMLLTVTLADGNVFVVTGTPVTREKVELDLRPATEEDDTEGSHGVVN
jgi:hypothetical protein